MSQENTDWPELQRVRLLSIEDNPTTRGFVFGGSSIALGDDAYEQKITIEERRVKWSSKGVVKRQFEFDDKIREVKWCRVPELSLCMFRESRLTFYTPGKGLVDYAITTRNSVRGIWPLTSGLLLQGEKEFFYLKNLYADYESVQFFDEHGDPRKIETLLWTSMDTPIVVTSDKVCNIAWSGKKELRLSDL